jgi:hypothetical protein
MGVLGHFKQQTKLFLNKTLTPSITKIFTNLLTTHRASLFTCIYLSINHILSRLPTHRIYLLQDILAGLNPLSTQLEFIQNWVIIGVVGGLVI